MSDPSATETETVAEQRFLLRLYVAGQAPKSLTAVDLNNPPEMTLPELLSSYSAEQAIA